MLAITGASAALALSEFPFQKTIAGVRVGLVDGKYIVNPTFKQRKESKLDLVVAGSKDGLVMVEAGAKEVTEEQVVEALETAHAAIKQIVADDRRSGEGSRQAEDEGDQEGNRPRASTARSKRRCYVPLTEAMRIRGKLENYETVDQALEGPGGVDSRGRSRAEARGEGDLQGAEGKSPARGSAHARRAARRPQVRRGAADLDRNRRAAPHPWLRGVHPRRNAGARHLHARHGRRRAEDRELRGRDVEELHAPLQLPAVLGRRGRRSCAAPDAAKWVTARWPSAR